MPPRSVRRRSKRNVVQSIACGAATNPIASVTSRLTCEQTNGPPTTRILPRMNKQFPTSPVCGKNQFMETVGPCAGDRSSRARQPLRAEARRRQSHKHGAELKRAPKVPRIPARGGHSAACHSANQAHTWERDNKQADRCALEWRRKDDK
jgi:hypothetical protein